MGIFIAIEGGDGSGKRTHSELLLEHMRGRDHRASKVSFPRYGNDSAYYVEQYLSGAYGQTNDVPADLGALAYAIDRYAASAELHQELARSDSVVIADRYMASNLAHQGAKIAERAARRTFYQRTKATEYDLLGIPKPTLTIVLLMPTQHMQTNIDARASRTSQARDIHEADADHLAKAKANFEELCQLYPSEFTAINCAAGSGAMRPIEDIQAEIRVLTDKQLALSGRM